MTGMRIVGTTLLLCLATACFADIITLRNGRVINGVYLGGTASQMQVQVGDNVETVNVADVARIEFRGSQTTSSSRDDSRPTVRRNSTILMPGDDSGGGPVLLSHPSNTAQSDDSGRPTLRRASNSSTPEGDASANSQSSAPAQASAPPQPSAPAPQPAPQSDDSGRPTLHRAANSSTPQGDAAANAAANPPAAATPAGNIPASGAVAGSTPAQGPTAAPIEIPANTNFVVRTIEAIDSDTAKEGQTFVASLDANVMVNGSVVIPMGTDVVLKLIDETKGGRISGKASLTIALWQVKIRGKLVDINTQNIERDSASKGAKTAKAAAVGGIVGAAIGGLAGGGKGAAIGAGAGAGTGTAASAMTRGEHVHIPSETRLVFVLDAPVTI